MTPGKADGTADAPADLDLGGLYAALRDPSLESMNFLNDVADRYPDAVSFAAGRPTEAFFELGAVHAYLERYVRYLREDRGLGDAEIRRQLFQYGPTKGVIGPLVARTLLADDALTVDPAAIVMTVGCQEGMFLILRALRSDDRDVCFAASPTYVGFTGAARLVDLPVIGVRSGTDGLDPADLTAQIHRARDAGLRPRACYLVPDFANPDGATMPLSTRRRLLSVAHREEILVLEDNPYGLFHGDAPRLPSLKALDEHRIVVYLGSFAKTLLPGARVGYVVADQRVGAGNGTTTLLADQLSKVKSMVSVNTSPITQAIIGGGLLTHDFRLATANGPHRQLYAANLQQLTSGLHRRFRDDEPDTRITSPRVGWNEPRGGFFVVLTVPFIADDAMVEYSARVHGVLWTPLCHFFGRTGGTDRIRLSISSVSPGDLEIGLDRLAALVRDVGAPVRH